MVLLELLIFFYFDISWLIEMVDTYEHFVAFGTDLVGIERILRLFQATCSILICYPALLALFLPGASETVQTSKATGLGVLRGQLNVSRRFIRFFRFLDTFRAGWNLYVAAGDKGLDGWLDVVSKTCFGIFGMMETMTLLDLCGIENLRIFSKEKYDEIDYQSQLFWFAGLYTSIIVSFIRVFRLFSTRPAVVPAESVSRIPTENADEIVSAEKELSEKSDATKDDEKKSKDDLDKERERLKNIVTKRKAERRAWLQNLSREGFVLARSIFSDTLDMLLPTTTVGWVKVEPGVVSLVMFLTTLSTGMAVWENVGRRLQKKA
ncbi:hypothetical protein NW754_003530 [Fusarium falciforme]|uniref:Hypothetical protein n=1 Tax=Fusarium falciforme TaxID=195108 RepID=UPI002300D36D|nr:Hypothetical protein NCS54_00305800 [Fusarium falciforme]KAJ4160406.1 hypothetical protein NW754_003530 [Fusarium falciforme]KAJ4250304.1 hypothetical protein NW757_007137 [Fusarium falciforme]WAO85809.1 Hypothetical protein NCS54_00305800 [Fusarium falciforme]